MPSDGAEDEVRRAAASGLRKWLERAKDAVLAPWRRFKSPPNPDNIAATVPVWQAEVDRILAALTPSLREGWAAASLPGDYDPRDPYIQANLALTKNLLVRVPDEVHAKVVAQILEGSERAESTAQIAARVQNVLDYTGSEDWPGRAKTIAQTECNRAFNGAMLAHGLEREKAGVRDLSKRWDTRVDGKERPEHHVADDQERPLPQPFLVGGENLLFPGDPTGSPWNVINCVPGDTPIVGANISGAYKFEWSGELVTVIGEQGLRLTVSPNHPMLSERGWLTASEVQQGDYLLGALPRNGTSRPTPDEQYQPVSAEKIFETLVSISHAQRVDRLSVDFYGDTPVGDVDVVLVHRDLSFGVNTKLAEELNKFGFACADLPAASHSTLNAFGLLNMAPTYSRVSSSDLLLASGFSHRGPLNRLRLGLAPKHNSCLTQSGVNGAAGDSEFLMDRVGRSSLEVFRHKVIDIEIEFAPHVWLYTFQTDSGTYLADNIVSHNCRCELRLLQKGRLK